MPAEWEKHSMCHLIVPHLSGNWSFDAKPGQVAHAALAKAIAQFEPVTVWSNEKTWETTHAYLGDV